MKLALATPDDYSGYSVENEQLRDAVLSSFCLVLAGQHSPSPPKQFPIHALLPATSRND
jgi:hypothetical protein